MTWLPSSDEIWMQLGWDQELLRVRQPFTFAEALCATKENADLDQESANSKRHDMAARKLRNSKKKARNSKRCKVTAGERFSCSACNRTYCSRVTLLRHLKCECGKIPSWRCDYCSYAGLYKASLRKHVRSCKRRRNIS